MQFKGIFESLVHTNPRYSNPEKMSYLVQSLKNEAARVLSDTENLNLSYPEAWALVCEWYENKTLIVSTLLKDLFAIRQISDSSGIRNLVLEIDAILHGLKSTDENPDHWGSILHFLMISKLDDETRRDWQKLKAGSNQYPQYAKLKIYLVGLAHMRGNQNEMSLHQKRN